jgi:hypothetical protein
VYCGCQQGLDGEKNIFPGRSGEVFFLDIPFYRTCPAALCVVMTMCVFPVMPCISPLSGGTGVDVDELTFRVIPDAPGVE